MQMYNLTIVTPAASEPVTYAELRDHATITNPDDQNKLVALGVTAREMIEERCRLTMVATTYELTLDSWADIIKLPARPVTSITSIKYLDADGAEQTLAPGDYSLDIKQPYSYVHIGNQPTLDDAPNCVRIRFVAGFATLPQRLKMAVCALAGRHYDYPESLDEKALSEMPFGFQTVINSFTVPEVY